MIKTIYIYKCDCCGKEWESSDNSEMMCTVAIVVSYGTVAIGVAYGTATLSLHNLEIKQWCRTCVASKGIREPITEKDKEVAPEKLLFFEDKVVELFNDLGFLQDDV